MQALTPQSETSSSPSPSASPGPQEQSLVLMLFLQAVAQRQPVPPNLAVAVLALSPQYQELLAIKLAEMEQADPEVVKPPQPALDALLKAKGVRLSNGQRLAQQLESASQEQRLALYRKGLEAGLVQGGEGLSGPQADKLLPRPVQRELAGQRNLISKQDRAAKAADLKQDLGVRGRLQ